jgi:hypothetical protein
MIRQLTVDLDRAADTSLIRANTRRAVDDVVRDIGRWCVRLLIAWARTPALLS